MHLIISDDSASINYSGFITFYCFFFHIKFLFYLQTHNQTIGMHLDLVTFFYYLYMGL